MCHRTCGKSWMKVSPGPEALAPRGSCDSRLEHFQMKWTRFTVENAARTTLGPAHEGEPTVLVHHLDAEFRGLVEL
jgi:hypothetical protein